MFIEKNIQKKCTTYMHSHGFIHHSYHRMRMLLLSLATPEIFWWGIKGATCVSEEQNSNNLPKWLIFFFFFFAFFLLTRGRLFFFFFFFAFFLLTRGMGGGRASSGGMSPCLPTRCYHCYEFRSDPRYRSEILKLGIISFWHRPIIGDI